MGRKNVLLGWWCPPLLLLLLSLSDDSIVTTVKKINSLYCLRKFLLNMKHAHIPTSFRRADSQTKRKWDAMYKFQKKAIHAGQQCGTPCCLEENPTSVRWSFFFFLLFFDGYYPQHTLHTQKLWSITPIQCLTCPRNTKGGKKEKVFDSSCVLHEAAFLFKTHIFLWLHRILHYEREFPAWKRKKNN